MSTYADLVKGLSNESAQADTSEHEHGIKLDSDPGVKEQGEAEIELHYDKADFSYMNKMAISMEDMGFKVKLVKLPELSNEAGSHDPSNMLQIKDGQVDGNANLVVNGVFVPDVISELQPPKKVTVIRPQDVIRQGTSGLVYIQPTDGDKSHIEDVKAYLKEQGYQVVDTIENLSDFLNGEWGR